MTEETNPKNWYIRLKENFFDTKEIKILKNMDNGKDYIILLLQLRLLTINTKGKLQFNNTIPYNEKMIADLTNTNIDVVRNGVKALQGLNMISMLDDGILYMEEVENLIGYTSKEALKKAKYREKLRLEKEKQLQIEGGQCPGQCPTIDRDRVIAIDYSNKNIIISTDKNDKNDKYSLEEFFEELKEDHKTRFINTVIHYVIKRFNNKTEEEMNEINNIPNYIKASILRNIKILNDRADMNEIWDDDHINEILKNANID